MAKSKKQIEIEFRALLTKREHDRLQRFLNEKAKDLGQDDKNVFFFIFPDKVLKVVNNVSKKNTEIVLKLNRIGKGSDFEEIEVPIDPKEIKKAVQIFTSFKPSLIMESFQKRHNYNYKGIGIALKHSEVWGYHLELEKVISDKNKQALAEKQIKEIAKELKVKLMSEAELKRFTKKAERAYKVLEKR